METTLGIIALLVGFVTGWLVRGWRGERQEEGGGLAHKLQQRDEELRAARAEIAVHTSTLDSLRDEYAVLSKKLDGGAPPPKRTGAKARRAASRPKTTPAKPQRHRRGKR